VNGKFYGRKLVGRPQLGWEESIKRPSLSLLKIRGRRRLAGDINIWRRTTEEARAEAGYSAFGGGEGGGRRRRRRRRRRRSDQNMEAELCTLHISKYKLVFRSSCIEYYNSAKLICLLSLTIPQGRQNRIPSKHVFIRFSDRSHFEVLQQGHRNCFVRQFVYLPDLVEAHRV
jgi:hypothetical protein